MSASSSWKLGVAAAGLMCLLLTHAQAQQATQLNPGVVDPIRPGQPDRPNKLQPDRNPASAVDRAIGEVDQNRTNYRAGQAAVGHNPVEHFLATCLLAQNKGEVELSQIALQRTENPEVKQFAQKMIDDHQKMIDKLQPLAMMQGGANRGASSILGGNSESQGRSESTVGRSSDTVAVPGSAGASQTLPPSGAPATATAVLAAPPPLEMPAAEPAPVARTVR